MEYLLDTNFLVGIIRRKQIFLEKFLSMTDDDLYISAITVTEIYAGCREHELQLTEELLGGLIVIPTTLFVAKGAGKIIKYYSVRGKKINVQDAIIGATAQIHHLVLITQNIKDFPMLYPSQVEGFPE